MGDTLHKMQVIIEATTEPLKKGMENSRREVKKSVEEIQKETEKVKNPFKGMESKALQPVRNTLNKIREMLSKNSVKNFQIKAGIKVPTEEYQQLNSTIQKTQAQLNKYYERRDKMSDLGVDQESRSWRSLAYDIEGAERKLRMYETDKKHMESSNTDVKRPVSLPKQALNFGTGIFKGIGTTVSKGWGGFTKLLGGVGNIASSFTGVIRKCTGAYAALIQKFTSGIPFLNRTKSSFNGLGTSGRGLTGILKTIGMTAKFMFASFVIRGAVDGAKQGFQNLAQYSGETNRSLSLLMSSLTQLKNSLATAFAPILNVVAPILNSFIQTVINVVNSIGQLMGALTGKTTMVTAKKVNQDYAASLNSTSMGLKNNAKNADTASKAAKEAIVTTNQNVANIETSMEGFRTELSETTTDLHGLTDNTLLYNVKYHDNGDGTTTLNAAVYKNGTDVTKTYPVRWYTWNRKTESGENYIGYGYSITVNNSDYEFGGVCVGTFATYDTLNLTTRSGKQLTTRSGKHITIWREK